MRYMVYEHVKYMYTIPRSTTSVQNYVRLMELNSLSRIACLVLDYMLDRSHKRTLNGEMQISHSRRRGYDQTEAIVMSGGKKVNCIRVIVSLLLL